MRIVTAQELESWLASGTVLEKDSRGPKVLMLSNGQILKIFHTRRHPMLSRLNPPAKKFAQNALVLHELGIPAPQIVESLWIDITDGISASIYQPLPGCSIESIVKETPLQVDELIPQLANFIKVLHQQGVYFRSLHLGNILQLQNGQFGLIDFLDLTKKSRPLSNWEIGRNFKHLERYLTRRKLTSFPCEKLMTAYFGS
jgi:hypothetical protein